jgi:hypothetical protein
MRLEHKTSFGSAGGALVCKRHYFGPDRQETNKFQIPQVDNPKIDPRNINYSGRIRYGS